MSKITVKSLVELSDMGERRAKPKDQWKRGQILMSELVEKSPRENAPGQVWLGAEAPKLKRVASAT